MPDSRTLFEAIDNVDTGALRRLLRAGASAFSVDRQGFSALERAVKSDLAGLIEPFIEAGIDLNRVDAAGRSALHIGAMDGAYDGIRRLLAAGVMPDVPDHFGMTPLMHAAENDQALCVLALLDAGASVECNYGRGTALDLASGAESTAILRAFQARRAASLAMEEAFGFGP